MGQQKKKKKITLNAAEWLNYSVNGSAVYISPDESIKFHFALPSSP